MVWPIIFVGHSLPITIGLSYISSTFLNNPSPSPLYTWPNHLWQNYTIFSAIGATQISLKCFIPNPVLHLLRSLTHCNIFISTTTLSSLSYGWTWIYGRKWYHEILKSREEQDEICQVFYQLSSVHCWIKKHSRVKQSCNKHMSQTLYHNINTS